MLGRMTLIACLMLLGAAPLRADPIDPALQAALDAPLRSEKNRVRDPFRHPSAVLPFFGIRPDSTIVEIDPGASGYWTEILAPYLKAKGRYIAANPVPTSPEGVHDSEGFKAKLMADPASYSAVEITTFAGKDSPIAPTGSADFVVTFRNLHNWMAKGETAASLATFYAALKPGGVLGIVDHRASETTPQDPLAKSGYVRPDFAIQQIEAAGFKLVAASEANANPKDTKDYPVGVWALPPTYRLKDVDRAKYQAIGESDRFTLKFMKPEK